MRLVMYKPTHTFVEVEDDGPFMATADVQALLYEMIAVERRRVGCEQSNIIDMAHDAMKEE